tara:strand:- start:43585 stop:44874 length:1290 start_codon:yes stop_codon:yes gene_type:complete
MHVFLQTLGCRLNEAELETWARSFRGQGAQLVNSAEKADLIVLNTCAVTNESIKKSRNLIRRAKKNNPQAKIIVSGCYATLKTNEVLEELDVELVVKNSEKDRLVEISKKIFPKESNLLENPNLTRNLENYECRHRGFIKVQDGCRYRCTYCIVTIARGKEVSRPEKQIIQQINTLHLEGKKEVVLTGVHLGGYGSDIGTSLTSLIKKILEETNIPRIRLGSLEPWDIPKDFWILFQNSRLLPHLHLPLQSGCDSVLKRMSRRCKTKDFATLVNVGLEQVDDLSITTDLIVGFPGETEYEWEKTKEFVSSMEFAHAHIFTFSPHDGTKAATLQMPVDRAIKRERSRELHEILARQKHQVLQKFKGRNFEVLFEHSSSMDSFGKKIWSGYTPNYLKVNIAMDPLLSIENQILSITTTHVDETGEKLIARV